MIALGIVAGCFLVAIGLVVRRVWQDTSAAVTNPANHDGYNPGSPERGYFGL